MNSTVVRTDHATIAGFKEIVLNALSEWGQTASAAKAAIIEHLEEHYPDAAPGSNAYTGDLKLILIKTPDGNWAGGDD